MAIRATPRPLSVVRPDETRETDDDHAREEPEDDATHYWARVQALRAELAGLRPAN